jgi:PAS domain S-box-containing protein
MPETRRGRLVAFSVAVLATAVCLFIRWPLKPVLGDAVPHMTFFPAVMIAAYFGGFWPGLLATLLSAVAANYYFTGQLRSFQFTNINDAAALILFVLTGAIISGLSESLHRARRRLLAHERQRSEEALSQERYLLRTLMDNLPDAIYFKDAASRFLRINKALTAYFGLSDPTQATGKTDFEFFTQEHTQLAFADEQQIIRTGQPIVGKEEKRIWLDGSVRWLSTTKMPFRNKGGTIIGTFGVSRDITKVKLAEQALRESEQRFRTFVDHATDAFFLQDDRGVILDVNRQACESLGYTREELVGKTPVDFDPDVTPAMLEELDRKLNAEEMVSFESRHRRKDGTIFPVEVRGRAFWEEGQRLLVSLARDVSERKYDEALLDGQKRILELIIQGEPLADVLAVLCRTIEELAQGEMLASVLLLDADGVHLRHGAAPSLPESYNRAVDGLAIGPAVGSCGTAAYRREAVYVSDIASDPLWVPFAELALSHGLRACWSSPILSHTGEVLGTFAMYYRQPRHPNSLDLRAVDIVTRTVAIAIERTRAEQALRESEHRWRCLAESLPQLVWAATADGSCDYFSTQWTQHTGIPEGELLGWRWLETLHPDDREPTRRFWLDSVAGRRPYDVEYRVRRQDGVYRWFKTRGVPIRDSDGSIVKWFGTCTDISDLRETEASLRESEERFRGTFENAAVGIGHADATGRWLRVNEKFCAIVGYPREELLQKTYRDLTHPEDLAAGVESFTALLRGDLASYALEKRYLRKAGSPVWVELFISLQRDAAGAPDYAIALVQDISERKRLERELRQAKEAAEAANRAKDEFLANVSHELRTPMTAILGMTELALDMPLTEDQRQCLKPVKSAADNLLGIINDLLDFSKIEAGKLELDRADFSLRAAVGDTLRALAVRAHKKELELIYQVQSDVPDSLIGDTGRLRQVLLNLVGNAIKFTDEGEVVVKVSRQPAVGSGQLETGVDCVPPTACCLLFEVRDTGIGIPRDKQERIFRAFEQEDTSTTRKYGGTGLGLTIASRLVALMGGEISVNSEPGRGSTFAFTARFERQQHPPEQLVGRPPDSLRNLPVLIVDDNATNRHILQEWLRAWQMRPVAVGDGVLAMDTLWHRATCGCPYALVLLDARMPDSDGLALAARIRERAELSATHIILLTSGDRPSDLVRSRELRVDAHLLKPVQQDELLETIYRVMSRTAAAASGQWPAVSKAIAQDPRRGEASTEHSSLTTDHWPLTTSLRVLVAEDNEFNAQLLEQLLTRRGHHVRVANNGREALEILRIADCGLRIEDNKTPDEATALSSESAIRNPQSAMPFDLLLLDVHMPELDGFQVVQAIREREQTTGGHLPIIALTARSRKEDREQCLAVGMDDFLAKPVQAADLWAAMDRVVANSSQQSAVRDQKSEVRSQKSESNDQKTEDRAALTSDLCPPTSDRGLLDPRVILAACGGDAVILEKICQAFRARLPEHVTAVRDALRDRDAPRLREAAHKISGMIAAFSTTAGSVASDLEDQAAHGELEEASILVKRLETMVQELMRLAAGLSLETLRRQAVAADDLNQSLPKPV